jgi:hypothetical protein
MSYIEEQVAREYFERNGFFLKHLHTEPEILVKVASTKKNKPVKNYPAYLIQRQTGRSQNEPLAGRFQLFSSDLGGLALAVMVVVGWSSEGLTLPIFLNGGRYRSWIRNEVVPSFNLTLLGLNKEAYPPGVPHKIILLPGLPVTEPYRQECIDLLKAAGADALFSFQTFLESLVSEVPTGPGQATSDLSEIIRLLKVYELVRSPQMDLFEDF